MSDRLITRTVGPDTDAGDAATFESHKMTRKNATVWVRNFMSAWRRFRLCVCVKERKRDDEMRMELSLPPSCVAFILRFGATRWWKKSVCAVAAYTRRIKSHRRPRATSFQEWHMSERDGQLGFRITQRSWVEF